MGLFSRLFALFSSDTRQPEPPRLAETKPAPLPVAPEVFIRWTEVLDGQGRIAAHLLQPLALSPNAPVRAPAILEALRQHEIPTSAASRMVILPLTFKQWSEADFSEMIGPVTHVLLAGLTLQSTPGEIAAWAAQIREKQGKVAIDDVLLPVLPELFKLADVLHVDVACQTLPALERKLAVWRSERPDLPLLATGISTWAEQRLYQSMGVHYGTGSFVGEPDVSEQAGKIGESRLVVMDMLNALRRDAALGEVTAIAKRDPAVVVKLLERVNAPIYGLGRQVGSLDEVVMILGREALYRWLSIALFSLDGNGAKDQTLLFLALCRAGLLETLAPQDRKRAAELYLVGLLSVVDSLLGIPRDHLLDKMHLASPVADALLRNTGPYARHWALVQALEQGDIPQALALAEVLQIGLAELSDNYRKAVVEAQALAVSVS